MGALACKGLTLHSSSEKWIWRAVPQGFACSLQIKTSWFLAKLDQLTVPTEASSLPAPPSSPPEKGRPTRKRTERESQSLCAFLIPVCILDPRRRRGSATVLSASPEPGLYRKMCRVVWERHQHCLHTTEGAHFSMRSPISHELLG